MQNRPLIDKIAESCLNFQRDNANELNKNPGKELYRTASILFSPVDGALEAFDRLRSMHRTFVSDLALHCYISSRRPKSQYELGISSKTFFSKDDFERGYERKW